MIIPSIDLMGGSTVQLVGGREKALDAGGPRPILDQFSLAGEVAVIDLDAAIGAGSNRELIESLVRRAPCRVGGGIRDYEAAIRWLDAGAAKIILGTAAKPELLSRLPRERLIAAVDCFDGRVVVKGWREGTGERASEVLRRLAPLVSGFLVTFVEREGRMVGLDIAQTKSVIEAAGSVRVTIAGGVANAEEIATLDRLGADAQVGMAIYTGRMSLADAIAAPLSSDRPDGLWPTVVVNEHGVALGLAYSDLASLREAIRFRRGVYRSRTRGLWIKGESSGATQDLLRVDLDCDRDTLRFVVRQRPPGFCHNSTTTCWGESAGVGPGLPALERTLVARKHAAPDGSYTHRLFTNPDLLAAKIAEEAQELVEARDPDHVVAEAADLLYFTLAKLVSSGRSLSDVAAELDKRALKVTRRPGNAKPPASATPDRAPSPKGPSTTARSPESPS